MKHIIGGISVIGKSHEKNKLPNQDNYKYINELEYQIIAVADGHGSETYFRSDIGSKFATESAIELLENYANSLLKDNFDKWQEGTMLELELEYLREELLNLWKSKINKYNDENIYHLEYLRENETKLIGNNKFKESYYINESEKSKKSISKHSYNKLIANPISAYGSTLTAMLMIKDSYLIMKIGDGDIAFTFKNETKNPIEQDDIQIANETYS